jgi:hypothetical protein
MQRPGVLLLGCKHVFDVNDPAGRNFVVVVGSASAAVLPA